MKLDPILTKAARLTRRGKFGEAIQTLEPEVVRYHDSFRYYYILGVSCLHAGDFGGAYTYFKRGRDIKMRDPSLLLGMAVLHLRRRETDRAVDLYLEVQEIDEKNRIAKKALGVIRKHGDPEDLSTWIDSGKLPKLYPPLPKVPPGLEQIIIPLLCVVLGLALCAGILIRFNIIKGPELARGTQREGFPATALDKDERDEPVQIGGSYRYILTRKQVLDTYEQARRLFTEYRDEAARVELNRILESNASEPVKNKARLFISYMEIPGFDTLKDRFSYADVIQDPVLYRDCHVIWRGMATNLDALERLTSFDFLVGYDTRSTLEGIVPVVFDFPVAVNLERPLEVLGRVVPVSQGGAGQGPVIRLEGIAVHQAGMLGGGTR